MKAVILLYACVAIVGAIECFAGFKIMKAMTAIWGFIIGAAPILINTAPENMSFLIVLLSVLVGALVAVLLMVLVSKFELAGVFLKTTLLTAAPMLIRFEYGTVTMIEDPFMVIILTLIAIGIGVLSLYFVKPIVILDTSIVGARIVLAAAYAIMMSEIAPNQIVTEILCVFISLVGILVQCVTTQNIKGYKLGLRALKSHPKGARTVSEIQYPGMQRAYRNFCIKCGSEMKGNNRCPRCGYNH